MEKREIIFDGERNKLLIKTRKTVDWWARIMAALAIILSIISICVQHSDNNKQNFFTEKGNSMESQAFDCDMAFNLLQESSRMLDNQNKSNCLEDNQSLEDNYLIWQRAQAAYLEKDCNSTSDIIGSLKECNPQASQARQSNISLVVILALTLVAVIIVIVITINLKKRDFNK